MTQEEADQAYVDHQVYYEGEYYSFEEYNHMWEEAMGYMFNITTPPFPTEDELYFLSCRSPDGRLWSRCSFCKWVLPPSNRMWMCQMCANKLRH